MGTTGIGGSSESRGSIRGASTITLTKSKVDSFTNGFTLAVLDNNPGEDLTPITSPIGTPETNGLPPSEPQVTIRSLH